MRADLRDASGSAREVPDARAQERPAEGDHRQRPKQPVPDRHVPMPANDSANDKEHERRRRREINHPGQSGPPQATQWRFGAAGLAVVVVDDVMVA